MSCGHRQLPYQSNDIHYPKDSLLKYEPPRLMVRNDISEKDHKKICRATLLPCSQPTSLYDAHLNLYDPYSDLCRPADILDFLFPPIEFLTKNNHKYIICVSRHPATNADVYNLEKNLNRCLKRSQALEVGLCHHRRRIYNECFDELVRHVTIECSERGILLSRIRDTFRQMLKNYLNNYLSANAYAMRTLLISEQVKLTLNHQIDRLEYEIEQLKKQLINTEDHYENVLKLYSRLTSENEYRYQTINITIPLELQQLRTTNNLLKHDLEQVLANKLSFRVSEKLKQEKESDLAPIRKREL